MSVETFSATFISRPVRDGMSVENAGCPSNPVPSGTGCGDCHIAYLTARGKSVAVNFSTNILSLTGQKTHPPLSLTGQKNATSLSRMGNMSVETFSTTFISRAVSGWNVGRKRRRPIQPRAVRYGMW
ncbi:MAG: hypothetical protein LBJ47_09530 [Tannerella sp.]|nr:hypothetical protein [Tannerella sp.]